MPGWTQLTNSLFSWHLVPLSLDNLYLDSKIWTAQPEQGGTSHALYSDGSSPILYGKKSGLLTQFPSSNQPTCSGWIDMFGWSINQFYVFFLVSSQILLALHPITFISLAQIPTGCFKIANQCGRKHQYTWLKGSICKSVGFLQFFFWFFRAAKSDLDLHVGDPRRAEVVIWWPRAKPRRKSCNFGREKFSNRNGEFSHGGFL